jgi:hypothetical protein
MAATMPPRGVDGLLWSATRSENFKIVKQLQH